MDRKIRVGAVSYLNTKPLLYGIEHSPIINDIQLTIDYPSHIASQLQHHAIDIGLVPVSIIPNLERYHINSRFCIGANGPVASVCIFSEVPIEAVDTILLDYQSRTSVELGRILLRDYWKTNPRLVHTQHDFGDRIKGATAGLVIGDRALEQRKKSKYIYDLSEAWKIMTGLPFVFAAWISNKELPPDFISAFDEANAKGLQHVEDIVASLRYDVFDLHEYYTRYISYHLDESKQAGLAKFLQMLNDPH